MSAGKAAADVDVQAERNFGVRQGEHDHVIEPDNLYADRRDAPLSRETVEHRLHRGRKTVARDDAARERQHPHAEAVTLGRVDLYQLLVHKHSKNVQARAGDHAEGLRDRLHAHRLRTAAEKTKDCDRPRYGGDGSNPLWTVRGLGVDGLGNLFESAFVLGQLYDLIDNCTATRHPLQDIDQRASFRDETHRIHVLRGCADGIGRRTSCGSCSTATGSGSTSRTSASIGMPTTAVRR